MLAGWTESEMWSLNHSPSDSLAMVTGLVLGVSDTALLPACHTCGSLTARRCRSCRVEHAPSTTWQGSSCWRSCSCRSGGQRMRA